MEAANVTTSMTPEAANVTTSITSLFFTRRETISDEALVYLGLAFKVIINPILAFLGIVANLINITVFFKMGLSDGVTQNFFILSITDGLMCVFSEINSITYILQTQVYSGTSVYVEFVHLACFLAATFPQTISLITTVVIAVVRCCCVAMPLQVKYLLTARRQLAAILVFSTSALSMLLYAFTPIKVAFVHNDRVNSSLPMFLEIRWTAYTLFTNIFFYIGFVVAIICVIILTISLNRSSKFRETSTSAKTTEPSTDTSGQAKEGSKETRIVKTVVFLCIIFILCYMPTLVFALFGQVEPEFKSTGFYRNANIFLLMFLEMSMMVNANVNIFVYLLFNSRYRDVFKTVFSITAPAQP
ncbi:chemosensory receptor A [Elysia marginata]|uniref:Chemosensory receptor A n=1 Tax=Elysia marginata TaxID=1093978 RepID=A0AAV4EPG6_9GAST|nr:chemosensory receptor A [Elysia marginata]